METYLLNLASGLVRRGYAVEIITTLEKGEWFDRIPSTGATSKHIPMPSRFSFMQCFQVGLELARGEYDAIFLNHAIYAQVSIRMLSNRTFVVPVFHNHQEHIYRVGCANRKAWNVAVAVSPGLQLEVRDRVKNRPVFCIPNGADIPSPDTFSRRTSSHGKMRLIFVGRIDHVQKAVLFLPDILKGSLERGVDASLVVIGDGPDKDLLAAKLSHLGLQDRTTLMGSLPNQEVFQHLLNADVLLFPSFFEGLPITPLEAMGCGCVPIASRLAGVTDLYIQDGVNGSLVEIGDIDGFVNAVVKIQSDDELKKSMSQAARSTVVERFSLDRMTEEYCRLIEEGVGGRYPLPYRRRWGLPLDLSLALSFERIGKVFRELKARVQGRPGV
jgi:glycosyltransferase involved in cell wall biosynthesis